MEIVNKIIDEYINLPGFNLFERNAFIVDEYDLDKEYRTEGFLKMMVFLSQWKIKVFYIPILATPVRRMMK